MYKLVLMLLCIVAAFETCTEASVITIPLVREESPRQRIMAVGTEEEQVMWLSNQGRHFEYPQLRKPRPGPLPNDSIAIYKYLDMEYYAVVGLGHPSQEFRLIIDTAWGNTWVPSKSCPMTCLGCWLIRKYNSDVSSTYQPDGRKFVVNQGSSNLTGFFSIDNMNVGHIKIQNQTFGEADFVPWLYLFSKADGIMGFAYNTLAINGAVPVFYNMIAQRLIKKPIFSVYLNRDPTTKHAGVMLLGATDPKHYNNTITYVDVTRKVYWQFKIDKIHMNFGKNQPKDRWYCQSGCEAYIDTSTSLISVPMEDIKNITKSISATEIMLGRYQVDCGSVTKMPALTFVINNQNFTIKGRDLVQVMNWRGVSICLSVFTPSEFSGTDKNLWGLGSAFIAQFYTVFDLGQNRLGFATAR